MAPRPRLLPAPFEASAAVLSQSALRRRRDPAISARLKRVLTALLISALATARAKADGPPRPLRYDLATDLSVTGAAMASMVTLLLLKPRLAPLQCHICAPDALDNSVHSALLWRDPHAADTASSVLANALLPAGLLAYGLVSAGRAGDMGAGAVDALLIAEAVSTATVLEEGVKYAAGRERPYAWYGHLTPGPGTYDRNLSFYSGHTSFAFATATAAGTVFMMRGYPGAPVVLGLGLAGATAVGYLRMAANEHYFTDVLAGAAIGGVVGFAVPWFFHRPLGTAPRPGDVFPAPGGIAVAW